MSLTALRMANTGNPVARLFNSNNVFLISATAIATIHFGLAFRVTALRLTVTDPEQWKSGTSIDFFRRTQLNVAEYSGALLAMLLFAQYKADSGADISSIGRVGALFIMFGSFAYCAGYPLQTSEEAHPARKLGATLRYLGMAALCWQLYKFIK